MFNYSGFLREVYGVDSFIRPVADSPARLELYNPEAFLQFILVKTSLKFSEEEKSLFEKIIAALKRPLDQIHLQVVGSLSEVQLKDHSVTCILMSSQPEESLKQWEKQFPQAVISTYAPADLLQTPELKKTVWATLQPIASL